MDPPPGLCQLYRRIGAAEIIDALSVHIRLAARLSPAPMEPERDDVEGSGHVTADIDAGESATESMDSSEGAAGARVVGAHLTLAILFFVVAIIGATIAAYQLAVPGSLDGIAFLSYGRLTPIFTSLFLYGWLTLGFLAAVHPVLPRVAGRPLGRSGAGAGGTAAPGLNGRRRLGVPGACLPQGAVRRRQ